MPADRSDRFGDRTPFEDAIIELSEDEDRGHGDHWLMFVDDLDEFAATTLRTAIEEGELAASYADTVEAPPYLLPEGEPDGALLTWPTQEFGMFSLIRITDSENELASAFPRASDGVRHMVELAAIRLAPDRMEAQLEGTVAGGAMPITFFDSLFIRHRGFYRSGDLYQFVLVGFAYHFESYEPETIVIEDPERARALRSAMHPDDPEEQDNDALVVFEPDPRGLTALFPRSKLADGSPDDYEFMGPVKAVAELPADMLGSRTWRVRVTVARPGEDRDDFDLDIYVTEKVLDGAPPPEIGAQVRGVFWLQGYLSALGAS